MTRRHRWEPATTRGGLPVHCGVKLFDGTECPARAGPFGACGQHENWSERRVVPPKLDASEFRRWYLAWCEEMGRDRVIPADLGRFLRWWERSWGTRHGPASVSLGMEGVETWWLRWRRGTTLEGLVPAELRLFMEWWRVR